MLLYYYTNRNIYFKYVTNPVHDDFHDTYVDYRISVETVLHLRFNSHGVVNYLYSLYIFFYDEISQQKLGKFILSDCFSYENFKISRIL